MGSVKWSYLMMLGGQLLLDGEVFRGVPCFDGFISASNKGRIYSHPRSVEKFCGLHGKTVTQAYKGRLLSQYERDGYLLVRFGIHKIKYSQLVSRLVLMAFDRMPNDGELACHNDSNTTNNCVGNLRWDSQTGNMKDRTDRGLYRRGTDHHAAKIPIELVDELQAGRISAADAAKKYGFRYSHLWRIANGQCWGWRLMEMMGDSRAALPIAAATPPDWQ